MLKKIIVSVMFFMWASIAQAQVASIPEGAKLNLNNFELDLTETVSTHFYLDRDGFKTVVYNSLRRRLQYAGLLSEANNPGRINVDVYVDYLRRFPGDQTPFPSSSLASPNCYINIKVSDESQVFYNENTAELTILGGSFFGAATDSDIRNDIKFLNGLVNTIMQKIALAYPAAKINAVTSDAEGQATASEYYSLLKKASTETDANYIPESVADDYIKRLQSPDFKSRVVAYQDIGRDWVNTKKLFEFIKGEISQKYKIEGDSDNTKEVREAMNALASSGLPEYSDFFKGIKANATDKKIVSQVDDSEKILFKRSMQGSVVHGVSVVNSQESWKVNQLARMALFSEPKLKEQAAKNIYLNFINNTYLLDTLANIFEKEAFKNNYTTARNANFHEWICRILGDSKNKKYVDFLNKGKNEAVMESVRKYATKYSKVLSNS